MRVCVMRASALSAALLEACRQIERSWKHTVLCAVLPPSSVGKEVAAARAPCVPACFAGHRWLPVASLETHISSHSPCPKRCITKGTLCRDRSDSELMMLWGFGETKETRPVVECLIYFAGAVTACPPCVCVRRGAAQQHRADSRGACDVCRLQLCVLG